MNLSPLILRSVARLKVLSGWVSAGAVEATGKVVYMESITEIAMQAWLLHFEEKEGGTYTARWEKLRGVDPFQVDVKPFALSEAELARRESVVMAGSAARAERLTPLICQLTSFTQERADAGVPFPAAWDKLMLWARDAVKKAGADYSAMVYAPAMAFPCITSVYIGLPRYIVLQLHTSICRRCPRPQN